MSVPNIKQSAKNLFINVPLSPVGSAICVGATTICAVASVASILTGGAFVEINKLADISSALSKDILTPFYQAAISVLNPNQKYSTYQPGVISSRTADRMATVAKRLSHSKKPVARELGSRAVYALTAVTYTVAKVCDLALGVLAGAASLLLLGQSSRLNDFANRHLRSTNVVYDVCRSLRGVVNPHQFPARSYLADLN